MSDCQACEVRDRYIAALEGLLEQARGDLKEAQDRLLAVVSPAALAQVTGKPMPGGMAASNAVESWVDDQGRAWVTLNGKSVSLEDYQELMKRSGRVDNTGAFISAEEEKRAEDKLREMMGGG